MHCPATLPVLEGVLKIGRQLMKGARVFALLLTVIFILPPRVKPNLLFNQPKALP